MLGSFICQKAVTLALKLNWFYITREELARIYTAEIVSAVAHLHANGIMHRDLKPENILLDADGHVRITDDDCQPSFSSSSFLLTSRH